MTNLAQNNETNNPTISAYEQQAIDFLNKTETTIEITFLRNGKHFESDKEDRDIYQVFMKKGSRSYLFNFGQSIKDSGFYYTKGVKKINIDRKHLSDKHLVAMIKKRDFDFLNNGKSDKIHYPVAPTNYDILACLQKYDVGTFEDFCAEFGYDTDSRTAKKTYNAVCDEYKNLCALFNESELELLQKIQ